jgi:hypothetical protein
MHHGRENREASRSTAPADGIGCLRTSRSGPKFSVEITFSAPGFAIILDN